MHLIHSLFKKITSKDSAETYSLVKLDETDSTNGQIRKWADSHPCAIGQVSSPIAVLTADYQTAGRGQGENTWESERGKNLLFSILIHPTSVPLRSQFMLSMMGALALHEALRNYLPEGLSLKWPNDIYWNDKKISGTLIETTILRGHIKDCVFGVGINVNQMSFSEVLPNPISLCQIVGHEVDRTELLRVVMESFKKYFNLIEEGGYADISAMYHESLYRKQVFYAYKDQDGLFEGAIVEVEDDGHLVLRDKMDRIRRYALGDVKFVV